MTVYNRERFLSESIESVLVQTKPDFELIIWDDGSTDSSLDIARGYAKKDNRIRLIEAEHKGRVSSLAAAIAESSAPFLGWVDSDDLLALTVLEETSAVLAAHPEVGLVYTDYIVIDEDGKAKGYGRRCRIPYSKERLLLDLMTFHFRLMRRSVFDQVDGINPSFEMAMDYDLCLRFSEVTEVRHIRKPLYRYRNHQESLSSSRRVEQMHYAKRAISEALERRGLADQFEVDLQIRGKFSLKRRRPNG
jgi:glycosyltransferase involved in cell wall biosynthesis